MSLINKKKLPNKITKTREKESGLKIRLPNYLEEYMNK